MVFEITDIDLEQLRSEQRQESLVRVMRALARPDIFEFEQEEQEAMAPVYVPCPADGSIYRFQHRIRQDHILWSRLPARKPEQTVTVEGFNFFPNATGPVRFVPGSDPSNPVRRARTM